MKQIMQKRFNFTFIISSFLLVLLFSGFVEGKRMRGSKRETVIMAPPSDVPYTKCGDDIKLTCMAQGDPVPDIEWWYQEKQPEKGKRKTIVKEAGRNGRIKIKVEEFKVIRSTLVIRDAEEGDEGIYQCRASNSVLRNMPDINIYQHWKIEQVPVSQVLCKETVTTQTQVFRASEYNQTIFDNAVEQIVTSLSIDEEQTTPSEKVAPDGKDKTEKPKTSTMTSPLTSSTTQHEVNPVKPGNPNKHVYKADKESSKKEDSRNKVKKETPKTKQTNVVGITRHTAGRGMSVDDDDDGNSSRLISASHTCVLLGVSIATMLWTHTT